MNRITHSVGTAGVAPAQLPSGSYRLTTGFAHSSGYLLTVVSFSPALAATPNSIDRAGFEPAGSSRHAVYCPPSRLFQAFCSTLRAGLCRLRVTIHAADPCGRLSDLSRLSLGRLRAFVSQSYRRACYSRRTNHRESNAAPVSPELSHRDGIEPSLVGRVGFEPTGLARGTGFTVRPLHQFGHLPPHQSLHGPGCRRCVFPPSGVTPATPEP